MTGQNFYCTSFRHSGAPKRRPARANSVRHRLTRQLFELLDRDLWWKTGRSPHPAL